MKRIVLFASVMLIAFLSAGCDSRQIKSSTSDSESAARYRERYKKGGGFDPVSGSVGQKMR